MVWYNDKATGDELTSDEWDAHVTEGHFPGDELNFGVDGGDPVITDPQDADTIIARYDRATDSWVLGSLTTEILVNIADHIVSSEPDIRTKLEGLSEGGVVNIGNGMYEFDTAISITADLAKVVGQNWGKQLDSLTAGTILKATADIDLLTAGTSGTGRTGVTLHDFVLEGNGSGSGSGTGLRTYVGGSDFERIVSANHGGNAFYFQDSGASDNTAEKLVGRDCGGDGFAVQSPDMVLDKIRAFRCQHGIQLFKGGSTFSNFRLWDIDSHGIRIESASKSQFSGGHVSTPDGNSNCLIRAAVGNCEKLTFSNVRFGAVSGSEPTDHIRIASTDASYQVQASFNNCIFDGGTDAVNVANATGAVNVYISDSYIGTQASVPSGVTLTDCYGPGAP